jgi:5-methyltetrahydrofolate--homocysteine methyltransferase
MTSAIMNPVRPQEMEAVRAANVLMGTDKDCGSWIRTYRDHQPAAGGTAVPAPADAGGRRRGGRNARRRATA